MGVLLLFLQFFLFFVLLLFSNLYNTLTYPHLLFLVVLGIAVAALGVFTIGRDSYSPFPIPRKNNKFTRKGIYGFIRHPMYAGLFLVGLAFLLSRVTALTVIIYFLFLVVSDLKTNLEEKLLSKKHPVYKRYKTEVGKYLPFLF